MTTNSSPYYRLIADVGGTNARFARLSNTMTPQDERILPGADYPDIVAAIEAYLAPLDGPRPHEAAIAIANPVTGDWVKMTNHSWAFSIETVRQQLGLTRLQVVNDFTALALSVPRLSDAELHFVGGGQAVPHGPIGVIGPGTGLGVSGLIYSSERWLPLQGEGGHVSISPGNPREAAILAQAWQRFGHVSAERFISGMGLQNIYYALSVLEGCTPQALSPAEISERGQRDTDPICAETLAIFCALLGSVAGNLALTLGATGGVYIGGGIVPRLGAYFNTSPFRRRFEDKGRLSAYLAAIPTAVIQAKNPAFIGLAQLFDE